MLALLEHQAKDLLMRQGFGVPRSVLLGPDDGVDGVRGALGAPPWMLKAQVIGHRRSAWGGVVKVSSEAELDERRRGLFARPDRVLRRVLVEQYRPLSAEWFCAVVVDASAGALRLIVTPQGGVSVDDALGSGRFSSLAFPWDAPPSAEHVAAELGVSDPQIASAAARLCTFALEHDAILVEANPIGTDGPDVIVLDAHMTADASAEFRQPWLSAASDEISELDPDVAWRRRWEGDFFILDAAGEVALINTGAGAGLFLLDELRRRGIQPFNFSDVRMAGVMRQPERIEAVVDRIFSSPSPRTILVNIHAGIGDPLESVHLIALAARRLREAGRAVVIRLAGRNADRAGETLVADGFTVRTSLREALDAVEASVSGVRV